MRPDPSPLPPPGPLTRERLEGRLERLLCGTGAAHLRQAILAEMDAYAAHMIETYARPDDRWGPQ